MTLSSKPLNQAIKPEQKKSQTFTIVKRNGVIVPFKQDRISKAIEAAFRNTLLLSKQDDLPDGISHSIKEVTKLVVIEAFEFANQGKSLTVEGLQDMVEKKLMEAGHHDIARNYIIYRDHHKSQREDLSNNVQVLRSDKQTIVRFFPMKIASILENAFRSSENIKGPTPDQVIISVNLLTNKTIEKIVNHFSGKPIPSSLIEEELEKQAMAEGFFEVAKHLILLHALKERERKLPVKEEVSSAPKAESKAKAFSVKNYLEEIIILACKETEDLTPGKALIEEALLQCYEGMPKQEITTAAIIAIKAHIENEPYYGTIASRVLLDSIYRETLGASLSEPNFEQIHHDYFKRYFSTANRKDSRLDPHLTDFDLDQLADAIDLSQDRHFAYLGLQTLYDRYFIHKDQKRLETPQIFWMRVAMGLSINERKEKNVRAIEFYRVFSQFLFTSSTPTLFNAGTNHPQLSSCYLSTVSDDLHHIFKVIADNAQLSKWAGGIGNDWTPVRATGSLIKGTNGHSQGVIPFLKVVNDTAVAVNQGGKRKGAACTYLETWHLDIEDFLELRKNTGDDRRRTHDMNTANWIPDLFMKRIEKQATWTLFSPIDTPDLHDLYGQAFEKRYTDYEKLAKDGKIKNHKVVDAMILWRKMLSLLFETGHPWITFKDPSNIRSSQDHVGVVHSSNLCTEILLNSSKEETAVCNLGSINLPRHITGSSIDLPLLQKTVNSAIRMLDNVIDLNFYPTKEAKTSNLRHRPIGIGIMGFQDALYKQNISYASAEAVEFADHSMEAISYYALLASSKLAKERGAYSSYKGSKWDKGILPIDSLKLLEKDRGQEFIDVDTTTTMDWGTVRKEIKKYGMRNSNTMAIAPTATIANIADITASIEPTYKHLFVKSNLSGEFTIINPYLVDKLKKCNLWDEQMVDDLKYFDGSLTEIERIPDDIKRVYLTAFEVEPEWIIDCAGRRQKWIDMGQSLNLYLNQPSGKKMHNMYFHAWKSGLKTTYYLRALGATQIEKSSADINKRGLQPRWMKNSSASSEITVQREAKQTPIVCNLEEGCESCQ